MVFLKYEYSGIDEAKKNIMRMAKVLFKSDINMIMVIKQEDLNKIKTIINESFLKEGFSIVDLSRLATDCGGEIYSSFVRISDSAGKAVEEMIRKDEQTMYINPVFKAKDINVDKNMIFCALGFNNKQTLSSSN